MNSSGVSISWSFVRKAFRCHDCLLKHQRGKRKGSSFTSPSSKGSKGKLVIYKCCISRFLCQLTAHQHKKHCYLRCSIDDMDTQIAGDMFDVPHLSEEDLCLSFFHVTVTWVELFGVLFFLRKQCGGIAGENSTLGDSGALDDEAEESESLTDDEE